MVCKCSRYHKLVQKQIGGAFAAYGRFVARHPWKFMLIGILVNGLLGIGMLRLNYVTDLQKVYTPINSQASKDTEKIKNLFPDLSGTNFIPVQMPDFGRQCEVIVKPNQENILDIRILKELRSLYSFLENITTFDENKNLVHLEDICAKRCTSCAVDGDIFIEDEFINATLFNDVSYPYFMHSTRGPVYYERLVGSARVNKSKLVTATMLILRVNLRTDSTYFSETARKWQSSFLEQIRNFKADTFEIAFSHSDSLTDEIEKNARGSAPYFVITFILMILYTCIATATARCDCVGQRSNLGFGGVLAAGLAIISSFGTVSLCDVEFVNIVGVVPFLVLGIGVDDMFLLMSGITETNYDDDVETRIGETMRTSGVSITITSLTDLLAFTAGSSSVFLSVRSFCIYSGVAVIFCYINQTTIFLSCLVINERRYHQNRHYFTCQPVKTADECRQLGKSRRYIFCCSGRRPRSQKETESFLDRFPRWLIPKLVLNKSVKVLILVLFACYFGLSVIGIRNMTEGLDMKKLISPDSYYYKYREWLDKNFQTITPMSFVFESSADYSSPAFQAKIQEFISVIKSENTIQDHFEINWLSNFKNFTGYNGTTNTSFMSSLHKFLSIPTNSFFENDIAIDTESDRIKASRIHVVSENIKDTHEQGNLMQRMRKLASDSPMQVFVFSPAFIYYEQYVVILSQTLQTVGIAVAMVFFVTCIFMPHPLLLFYVTIITVMITIGVLGFLYFLGLSLSALTMIHIIMSIGYSVDFAAHTCHGYIISQGKNRNERMKAGIIRSGAPIFHGAISSLLGVATLAFARSYIFYTFFQVMSMVIMFGILHALLLLPVILSVIGPMHASVSPAYKNVDIKSAERRCSATFSLNQENKTDLSFNLVYPFSWLGIDINLNTFVNDKFKLTY